MSATPPASTARPASSLAPASFPGDQPISPAVLKQHKVSPAEYARIEQCLGGRAPTYTELGVFSVMWSEHCSYKSSRVHLRRLPTKGPRVIQGPGENAGVVDIGDGFAVVFKMESHNHPSFIEPHQGAATGVGGILRDVFTMGARPIASLNSLRFGSPTHPRTPELLRGVVAGIGGYGNCIGVPTVGGEVQFDPAYDGNILVNAFTCGVARTDRIFYGRASGIGNSILYIGAKTGRDGIHGATMASDEFSAGGPSQRPTMQVGDPFMGKLLLEACLELFSMDVLEGIQDMGAAGLTSSSVEMAGRAQNGIELDLDAVPRRTNAMLPYEILLSESQERMLLVAKPGCEEQVLAVCRRWDIDAAVIGTVTDTKRWVIKATPDFDPLHPAGKSPAPVVVCDLPIDALTDEAPIYDRPRTATVGTGVHAGAIAPEDVPLGGDLGEELLALCGSPNLGSRRWIWRQYDHIVRGGTLVAPGSDAGVVRVPCRVERSAGDATKTPAREEPGEAPGTSSVIPGEAPGTSGVIPGEAPGTSSVVPGEAPGIKLEKLLAFSADCNGRHVALSPFEGAARAVAEVCRNLVCSGAEPIGITDCLNFGNPERPEIMDQFARAIDGLAAACNALAVPIVSGNVSLYNETQTKNGPLAILPTPTVAAVGLVNRREDIVTAWFKRAGDRVVLLGALAAPRAGLSGSEYLAQKTAKTTPGGSVAAMEGDRPTIDLAAEGRLQQLVLRLARAGKLASAHDVSDGGLAVALAECTALSPFAVGDVGARIDLDETGDPGDRLATLALLFGEAPSRVVVSVAPEALDAVLAAAAEASVPAAELGVTGGSSLSIALVSKRAPALPSHPDVTTATTAAGTHRAIHVPVERIRDARERCLEPIVGR